LAAIRLAVLGDPLSYTRSPDLHLAGLAALGLQGESLALRTPVEGLAARLAELAAAGHTGVNLTHPLKEAALALVNRAAPASVAARSVNTIGFEEKERWGDTTDGAGFVDLLHTLRRDPARERVVVFGSGGASRSLALALLETGSRVSVASRDPARARDAWGAIGGARLIAAEGRELDDALGEATLVVNGTPTSSDTVPVPPARLPRSARLVDLTYGPAETGWVRAARAAGLDASDGLGLLVHQARRSLSLWFHREVPLEPLARAVGWAP